MNPTPCIAPEEVGAVLALPAGDPRRAHLDTCPRCRALATAHRAFLEPPAPPAGARLDDAEEQMTAWRERFFAAPEGSTSPPAAARPLEARRTEPRAWWTALLAPAWRPAWAFAALVVVVGGALVLMRRPESTLRGGTPAAVTIEAARWLPDGGVRLAWHGSPDAARFEVRLYSTALEPLKTLGAATETTLVVPADSLPAPVRGGGAVLWRVALVRADGSVAESPVGTLARP